MAYATNYIEITNCYSSAVLTGTTKGGIIGTAPYEATNNTLENGVEKGRVFDVIKCTNIRPVFLKNKFRYLPIVAGLVPNCVVCLCCKIKKGEKPCDR